MRFATKKLVSAMRSAGKTKTSGYDTSAVVKRIEGGTAWVHIPGGVPETPVKLTINAHEGDTVQVRVSGGKAWLVGNATAPPTDDFEAKEAKREAKKAASTATSYITDTDKDGIKVHAANSRKDYAKINEDGFYIYKAGKLSALFESNQAKLGSGKAIVKYSEDGSAFGIQDSHRVVVAKATDENGVRNDATLSSREISTFTSSKPMAFFNATHKVSGGTKASQAGMYAWSGSGIVPIYVILQDGNGTGSDPLGGDAARGLYMLVPKLIINGNDWTNLKGDYDATAAELGDLSDAVSDLALDLTALETTEPNASTKFVREKHSISIASISAGGTSGEHSEPLSKPGYYPVGIVGWKSAAGKVIFPRLEITSASTGSATVTYNAYNASGSASGALSATIDILWVKTSA